MPSRSRAAPLLRRLAGSLLAALVAGLPGPAGLEPAQAREKVGGPTEAPTEAWVATVLTKITRADRAATSPGAAAPGAATVTVRLRVGADGTLVGAVVEAGSGSAGRDARALRAVRAAAPFPPPPKRIVTLEGFTELAFPLRLDAAGR